MATLKAYITWEVAENNGEHIASSYEHISTIGDAEDWVDKMLGYMEEGPDEDEEE